VATRLFLGEHFCDAMSWAHQAHVKLFAAASNGEDTSKYAHLRQPDLRGHLHVMVHEAKDLPAADIKLIKASTSDPYCRLTLGDQKVQTREINADLNPTWEKEFRFQLGTYLDPKLLQLLGASTMPHNSVRHPKDLEIEVLDHDNFSADDSLGTASVPLADCIHAAHQWKHHEVDLRNHKGKAHGKVALSICWQPAPVLTTYTLHVASGMCYAAAFAMFFIAANCRWQRASLEEGALKQPGVGPTCLLGAIVMLVALLVQFVDAHWHTTLRLDDLAEAHDAWCVFKSGKHVEAKPLMQATLKAKGLSEYEINVASQDDLFDQLHLGIAVLVKVLPIGGAALASLSLLLQMQDFALGIYPGEVFVVVAIFCVGVGFCSTGALGVEMDKHKEQYKQYRAHVVNFGKEPPRRRRATADSSSLEAAVSEKRQQLVHCTLGHPLVNSGHADPGSHVHCDKCGIELLPGSTLYECRKCNYDICPKCYAKALQDDFQVEACNQRNRYDRQESSQSVLSSRPDTDQQKQTTGCHNCAMM